MLALRARSPDRGAHSLRGCGGLSVRQALPAPLHAAAFSPERTRYWPLEYRVLHVVGRISMHRAAGRPALSHAAPARPASDGAHPYAGIHRLPGKRIARARPLAASLSRRGDRDHRSFSEKRHRSRRKACRLCEIGPLRLRAVTTPVRWVRKKAAMAW